MHESKRMEDIKVRKPYNRWVDLVREKGFVGGIPVADALYLKRIKELRNVVNINPIRHNVFGASLGQFAFRSRSETVNYKFYEVLPSRWKDLIK